MILLTQIRKIALLLPLALASHTVFSDQTTIDTIENASQQNKVMLLTDIAEIASGYDSALVNYRLAIAHNIKGQADAALTFLDNAEAILTHDELSLDNSEKYALLAQVYGYRISIKPMQGFSLGSKSSNALSTAIETNNNNPRAYLVKAISAYNTPSLFGGSKQQALKALNKALDCYQTDNNHGYQWGLAETYVWRGLTHLALNDSKSAIKDWQTSLEIAPNYAWPKMLIESNQG
ncbi:hypothetical protein [Pseudoalteromonas sp.]|uniref:hypothetical protein n=1 Tax=Pseudoalteromonas sp. TaxID=53249 RepID=UPI0035683241